MKSLNAKNAFLRQKKDRLEADNRKGLQHNKDLKQANEVEQQKHEMTVLRLEQETERDAMRLQQDKARLQHEVEQLRLGPQPGNEGELTALVESPSSAEDIERRASTEPQSPSAAVEAATSEDLTIPSRALSMTLPWKEVHDKISGEVYYHNSATGETTWQRPAELPAGDASTAATSTFAFAPATLTSDGQPAVFFLCVFDTVLFVFE